MKNLLKIIIYYFNSDELEMIKIPSNDDNTFRAQFENFEHHISDLAINKYTAHLPHPRVKPKTCNVVLEIQGPEVYIINLS